jgi:hypothetical protein
MYPYSLTPSPEEFAQVASAAIFLAYRLIFAVFTDLVTRMPNRIALSFIFVIGVILT